MPPIERLAGLRCVPRSGLQGLSKTTSDVDATRIARHDLAVDDDIDAREAERIRRRDREAEAEQRELMRPGMGKVFKQIQDAQAKAASEPPRRRRKRQT
jgi:hypothetical protein